MSDELTEYEQGIIDDVAEYGWFCVAVVPGEDSDNPGFAYSVGFTETLGLPEYIVFGLDHELIHAMLWNVFRALKKGREVRDGDRWSGLLADFDCVVRAVHRTNIAREHFNSALWYHGDPEAHGPLQAMQIIWPDSADGRFPWDLDCSPLIRALQPPLYLPGAALH
jgi:hypothetical protein